MPSDSAYTCDSEFLKLLTRRGDIDLTVLALELARDAYPDLDFRTVLDWVDNCASQLSGSIVRSPGEPESLQILAECLAERHGIYGDDDCYERADSSYLHRVIETGRGLPITLSVLYMAVAERVGIDLRGVSAPKHFLTRYESVEGTFFVDPFARGRLLSQGECIKWICGISGLNRSEVRASLKSVGPRTIVIRLLNN